MTMTDDRMALIELVEKQADGDLVREMLAFAAERVMEAEIEARTGAAKGARSPMREAQRNGNSNWDWSPSCEGQSLPPASSICVGRQRRRLSRSPLTSDQ
jgi:hypothetical protein